MNIPEYFKDKIYISENSMTRTFTVWFRMMPRIEIEMGERPDPNEAVREAIEIQLKKLFEHADVEVVRKGTLKKMESKVENKNRTIEEKDKEIAELRKMATEIMKLKLHPDGYDEQDYKEITHMMSAGQSKKLNGCPECGRKTDNWKSPSGTFAPEAWEHLRENGIDPATGHKINCSRK